jgi:hypothetical protein
LAIYLDCAFRQLNLKLDGFARLHKVRRQYEAAYGAEVCDVSFATRPCALPSRLEIDPQALCAPSLRAAIFFHRLFPARVVAGAFFPLSLLSPKSISHKARVQHRRLPWRKDKPLLFLLHSERLYVMQSIVLHKPETDKEPLDTAVEMARLEALLEERRRELAALQEEMRVFKARYTEVVGGRLASLSEIEREIKRAEARLLGVDEEAGAESSEEEHDERAATAPVGKAMRKLFWAVAKLFHPDHASDEREARARHSVMAEASRAYREGDVESLHTLLGDEQLQSLCAVGGKDSGTDDEEARLLGLEIELRTVEFGIRRIRQDGLYHTRLKVEEATREGRDALAQMAEQIDRQITKARHRLAHLS